MRTIPLWQIPCFCLIVRAQSLPDWNTNTQTGEVVTSESSPGNGIDNPSLALGTMNGINDGVNVVSSEISIGQDTSDCAPDIKRVPGKKKARRDNLCPADRLQFNNGEKGRQFLPNAPNGQQGGSGGNSGGGGSSDPLPPILRFPRADDPVQYIFIPKKIRPSRNEEICPQIGYPVPVCAREADAYISGYPVAGDRILDPCHLYVNCADEPLMDCLFMEGQIGYCCLMTTVAYSDLDQDQLNRWQNLVASQSDVRMFLSSIEMELQSGLPNPFKLIGIDCIPMEKRQGETKRPETPL